MSSYLIVLETDEPIATPLGETDHIAIHDVDPVNIEPRHTAVGLWSVDTAGVTDAQAQAIEAFAATKAETKIYVSDEHYDHDDLALAPGPLHNTAYDEGTGELALEGEDAAYYLLAGSADGHYQNETVPNALRDYWSRVDGFEAQVDDPEPRTIAEDVTAQSATDDDAFEILFVETDENGEPAIDDETPVAVIDNGLALLQTGWPVEADAVGDDPDQDNPVADDEYSGGEGIEVGGVGGNFEFSFDTDYQIPELALAFRRDARDAPETCAFDIYFDGNLVDSYPVGSLSEDLGWTTIPVTDVDPGSHTFEIDITSSDDPFVVDVLAPFDTRFTTTDNEVHEPGGALDSPHRYPIVELETVTSDAGNMIDGATLTIAIDDTGGDQRLQVSFDGDEWLPADGSENNTDSVSVTNDAVATNTIQGRVRLSRTEPDGPQDVTPRYGYAGQTVSEWELTVDLSSLGVVEDLRVDDDHLANLQEIHSRGDYRFTLIPSDDKTVQVRSYQRGTWEIEDVSWQAVNRTRSRTTEEYWNAVTIKGPRDDDGERPVTTREDAEEIDRVDQRLEKTRIRNDLETEADRSIVATQELLEAVDATNVTGEIEAAPTLILPGPRYYVEAWDAWVDLEELRYSDQYSGGNALLDFDKRAMLVDRLGDTQQDLSREKR